MLLILAAIFIILWGTGQIRPHKMGNYIHVLLIIALILILLRYIPGLPFPRY